MVYQNTSNPIIEPLKTWIKEQEIELIVNTSSNLREDVQALLQGDSFLIGKGTFMVGILGMKKHVRNVYVFSDHEKTDLQGMSNI